MPLYRKELLTVIKAFIKKIMEIAVLLFWKIANMFCIMGIGAVLYRIGILSDRSTEDLGKILVQVIIPSVILNQLWTEYSAEKQAMLIHSFVLSAAAMALSAAISSLRFRDRKDAVSRGGSTFSNVGFFGIPVVTAAMGADAILGISPTVAFCNLLMSSLLVYWLSGRKDAISISGLLKLPTLLVLFAGILLFALRIPKPAFCADLLSTLTQLNTPVALLLSGAFLAKSDLVKALKNPTVWRVCLWRLVLIPLMTLLLLKVIPIGSPAEKMAIWICLSCPIGMNLPIFAKLYDEKNVSLAAEEVCISTLMCILTLPPGLMIADMLL
ncbi:MAG: AEC family transporter [Oscillospiraceae bacterium]|nr:AEC family transporter [Oscillospiraceae bacterium]